MVQKVINITNRFSSLKLLNLHENNQNRNTFNDDFFFLGNTYPNYGESNYNEDDGSDDGYDYNPVYEDIHDGCTGLITRQSCDIKKFPEDDLRSNSEFENVQEKNFCCKQHAYVAKDECEVSIY